MQRPVPIAAVFFEWLLAIGLILLLIQMREQRKRLAELERSIEVLKKLHRAQSVWIESLDQRFGLDLPPARHLPEAPARAAPRPAPGGPEAPPPPAASSPRPPRPAPQPPRPADLQSPPPLWQRLEKLFSEHWSGILGVLVLVAGVTFLAINVALRMGPLQRFVLLTATSGAMALPAVLLGRRDSWRNLTAWVRSGGGALFLFACTAAGGLPRLGLQWVDNPAAALALLVLGVSANLALAACARTQTIASLHVVVNLLPLLIVPQGGLTLAIATAVALVGYGLPLAVALVGYGLPLGRLWNRHHLIVTWAYAAFHATWFLRADALLEGGGTLRLAAGLVAVLVFGGSALLRQRSGVLSPRLEALPLAQQLSSWGALALALLIYPQQATTRAVALAVAALLGLALSWRARQRGWRWLRLCNVLVAQAFAMAAVVSLQPLIANGPLLLLAVQVECSLFLGLGLLEGEVTIRRVGWWLTVVAGLSLALAGLGQGLAGVVQGVIPPHGALGTADGAGMSAALQTSGVLIGGTVLTTHAQHQLRRRSVGVPLPPLLGWLAGAQAFVAAAIAPAAIARPLLALVVLGALVLVTPRLRPQPPGLLAGAATAIGLLHGTDWSWLLLRHPLAPPTPLLHLLSLAGLALALVLVAPTSPIGLLGLDLLGLNAALGAWLLLEPIAPQLPAVAWLMLALIALEVANRLGRPAASHSLVLGIGCLVAFGGAYVLVIHQSPALIRLGLLSVRGRLLIELFAIAVATYWALFPSGPRLAQLPLWQRLQPCFLEVALAGGIVTILTEIGVLWRPLAWSLLALALLCLPQHRRVPIRLQLYSVVVYWLAVATVVGMLGTLASPALQWFAQPHLLGLLAIALQTGYIIASHRWLDLERLRQPGGLAALAWLGNAIANRRNAWLDIPMFVAVAVYLGVRYDRALLTLLWTTQALVIYGLSAVLRERQFRHLALLGLGACLVRLLAVDMAQADLGLRGLVFVGVGLLMLALNAIANRFRSRFE